MLYLPIFLAFSSLLVSSFRHNNFFLSRRFSSRQFRVASSIDVSDVSTMTPDPFPGSPVVKKVDKENNIALIAIALTGTQTQKAFQESCDLFNSEVKKKEYKVQGFRPGAKLPPAYLYQIFGEDQVKLMCANLLTEEIQDECEKTGLVFVGRGRIINFNEKNFVPGKTHTLELESDLWPEITYSGPNGYKGLSVTVTQGAIDNTKYEKVLDIINLM